MNFDNSIVIDDGSHTIKSGFGGDNAPRSVIPSIVGRQSNRSSEHQS